MGPYLGMNPVAKNGNMILKILFSSLIIPILDGPNSVNSVNVQNCGKS